MTDHQNHQKQTQIYPGNVKRTKTGLVQCYQRKDKLTVTYTDFHNTCIHGHLSSLLRAQGQQTVLQPCP